MHACHAACVRGREGARSEPVGLGEPLQRARRSQPDDAVDLPARRLAQETREVAVDQRAQPTPVLNGLVEAKRPFELARRAVR